MSKNESPNKGGNNQDINLKRKIEKEYPKEETLLINNPILDLAIITNNNINSLLHSPKSFRSGTNSNKLS